MIIIKATRRAARASMLLRKKLNRILEKAELSELYLGGIGVRKETEYLGDSCECLTFKPAFYHPLIPLKKRLLETFQLG